MAHKKAAKYDVTDLKLEPKGRKGIAWAYDDLKTV